jgi:uncharacterized protein (DUF1501 family)
MLNISLDSYGRLCSGWSRRDILRVGSAGALGLSLADLLRAEEAGAAERGRDKSCILLMLIGAPPQHETWDPKPDAPENVRGPFKPIETNVPGIRISETLPLTAKHADKYAILRSLGHSQAADHETGHQVMHTGHFFPNGLDYPHMGTVISYLKGDRAGMPANLTLPTLINNTGTSKPKGQDSGYLGRRYNPFVLNGDPSKAEFKPADLQPDPAAKLTNVRVERRLSLRAQVDRTLALLEQDRDLAALDASYQKAFGLITSSRLREAFDIGREPDKVRDRYGRTTFGQSCLLARRLIERGVRFVDVNMYDTVFGILCWDCHADGGSLFTKVSELKEKVAPIFDQAYSALLEDLTQRGMYDDTVVCAFGEFGRTAQINANGGRDHWPQCWSVALGGGGIKGGQVVGASDANGAYPHDRPLQPEMVAATVYKALGIDPHNTELPGPSDRPYPLIDREIPVIHELL